MAEVEYSWPANHKTRLIGKRVSRLDGLDKSSGQAKYTYDINLPNQLVVRALGCPHPHCKVVSVDTTQAAKVPGVVHIHYRWLPSRAATPWRLRPMARCWLR